MISVVRADEVHAVESCSELLRNTEQCATMNLKPAGCAGLPSLRVRQSDVGLIYRPGDTVFVSASSRSESIAVPMIPSLAKCAISVSESSRSPDRISLLCCPSVGAGVRIA